jgi:hypothetical protein
MERFHFRDSRLRSTPKLRTPWGRNNFTICPRSRGPLRAPARGRRTRSPARQPCWPCVHRGREAGCAELSRWLRVSGRSAAVRTRPMSFPRRGESSRSASIRCGRRHSTSWIRHAFPICARSPIRARVSPASPSSAIRRRACCTGLGARRRALLSVPSHLRRTQPLRRVRHLSKDPSRSGASERCRHRGDGRGAAPAVAPEVSGALQLSCERASLEWARGFESPASRTTRRSGLEK